MHPQLLRPALLILAGLASLFASSSAQTSTSWIGPSGGQWANPANWSSGSVPNSADSVNISSNGSADLSVSLSDTPFTIAGITVSIANTSPSFDVGATSVILGSASSPTDELTLINPAATPFINVFDNVLKVNARLSGTQGFRKSGSGTLSFRDNPRAQTFSGDITLSGGALEIADDASLGAPANSLLVSANSEILGHPLDPAFPLEISASRSIGVASSCVATLGNTNAAASLIVRGPLTGAGGAAFNGIGSLTLAGDNSISGGLSYLVHPPCPAPITTILTSTTSSGLIIRYRTTTSVLVEDSAWISNLNFEGADALPPTPPDFTVTTSTGFYVRGVSSENQINLGNHPRHLRTLRFSASFPSGSRDSTLETAFANGELTADSAIISVASNVGSGITNTLRFDQVPQLTLTGSLSITGPSSGSSDKTNSSRLRVGARSTLNLSSLTIDGDADCRLDAPNPGSTLTLRGLSGAEDSRVPLLRLGNGGNSSNVISRSLLDLSNGSINIRADRLLILGQASGYATTADSLARLSFSDGLLDVSTLELGSRGSRGSLECSVVQSGGTATVDSLKFGPATVESPPLHLTRFAYQLDGGRLSLGSVSADAATYASGLTRALAWSAGTVLAHNSITHFNSASAAAPLDLDLRGNSAKNIEIPSDSFAVFGSNTRLRSDSSSATLGKIGPGTLVLAGDSSAFTGLLRVDAGALALGENASPLHAPLGALAWRAGALAFDLSATDQSSDRLVLARSLLKHSGPASGRIIDLKSSPATGTYTLATYASTDLTLADFTVTGVASGCSADFTVGPAALTVTLAPSTSFSTWRSAKFASAANLGDAHDLADPDADGRPNLLEYALGSEPLASDSGSFATVAKDPDADRMTLSFSRIADPALTYSVYAADDPSGPWSGEGSEIVFISTGADNVAGPVDVSDSVPLSTHPRRFLRLVVSR